MELAALSSFSIFQFYGAEPTVICIDALFLYHFILQKGLHISLTGADPDWLVQGFFFILFFYFMEDEA